MSILRFGLALLLPVAIAACSPADTTASATTTPATTTPAVTEGSVTAAAPEAAPNTNTPKQPSGPAPIAGTDYIELPGQPYRAIPGKIEVAEVFGYTCGHCYTFEPLLNEWRAQQPADVNVVSIPALFGGFWDAYAKAYVTAETLNVADKSHEAMFEAIHKKHTMPGPEITPEKFADFYSAYGVDKKVFIDTYKSVGINAKLERAHKFATDSKVDGTPTFIVNGKYLVTLDGKKRPQDIFNTIDWLVHKERNSAVK